MLTCFSGLPTIFLAHVEKNVNANRWPIVCAACDWCRRSSESKPQKASKNMRPGLGEVLHWRYINWPFACKIFHMQNGWCGAGAIERVEAQWGRQEVPQRDEGLREEAGKTWRSAFTRYSHDPVSLHNFAMGSILWLEFYISCRPPWTAIVPVFHPFG